MHEERSHDASVESKTKAEQLADELASYQERLVAGHLSERDAPDGEESTAHDPADLERLRELRLCIAQLEQARLEVDEGPSFGHGDDGTASCAGASTADPASGGQQEASGGVLPEDGEASPGLGWIGRFRLEQRLGGGGQGVVYRAFDPVLNRQVALKIPRPEIMVRGDLRRRFLREARGAARFSHQNLTTVFEVGEAGPLCFIASAYCPGPNLAQWLATHQRVADPREAAQVAAALAEATDYIHRAGVLHRDIKPANILLDPLDGTDVTELNRSTPKLTDFGLIRLVNAEGSCSGDGALVGTPSYMAPEQARGDRGATGPASDVYGLGTVLYEMVTGTRPLAATSDAEAFRQVLDVVPVSPRSLRPELPRDLEAICLKCLEKLPERRYASAGALAEDLKRYLSGEPTVARPLSPAARLARWASKQRATAAMLGVAALALVSVTMISLVAAARVGGARDEARRTAAAERTARERADRSLAAETTALRRAESATRAAAASAELARQQTANSQQVSAYLVDLFSSADPIGLASLGLRDGDEVGMDLPLSELLARGASRARRTLADQPLVLATLLDTLGTVYCSLAKFDKAEPLIRDAWALRQEHGASPADLTASKLNLGVLARWQGQFDESEKLLRQALAERQQQEGVDSLGVADVMVELAMLNWQRQLSAQFKSINPEDHELSGRILEIRQKKLGPEHRQVAQAQILRVVTLLARGEQEEATRLLEATSLTLAAQEGGEKLLTIWTELNTGQMLRKQGDKEGALSVYERILPELQRVVGRRHPFSLLLMTEMGGTNLEMGRPLEAVRLGREMIGLAEQVFPAGTPQLIDPLGQLAGLVASFGEFDEALRYQRRVIDMSTRFRGASAARADQIGLAGILLRSGRLDEAGELLRTHRFTYEDFQPNDDVSLACSVKLEADLWHCAGELEHAQQVLKQLITYFSDQTLHPLPLAAAKTHLAQLIVASRPDDSLLDELLGIKGTTVAPPFGSTPWHSIVAAKVLAARQQTAAARACLSPTLEWSRSRLAPTDWLLGYAEHVNGELLIREGIASEAEARLRQAVSILRKSCGERHWQTREAAASLVELYRNAGRHDDATEFEPLLVPATFVWDTNMD